MAPSLEGASTLADVRRDLGASSVWLLALSVRELLERGLRPAQGSWLVAPLAGAPVCCLDVRSLGKRARALDKALIVDDSLPGACGCAAVRLGAHAAYMVLGERLCLVAVARDAEHVLPGVCGRLERLSRSEGAEPAVLGETLAERARAWQAQSDAAQVVASYLRCHPQVHELRYPGLKGDPSFAVAARTLQRGFGPFIDWRAHSSSDWSRIVCTADDSRTQIIALERALMEAGSTLRLSPRSDPDAAAS